MEFANGYWYLYSRIEERLVLDGTSGSEENENTIERYCKRCPNSGLPLFGTIGS